MEEMENKNTDLFALNIPATKAISHIANPTKNMARNHFRGAMNPTLRPSVISSAQLGTFTDHHGEYGSDTGTAKMGTTRFLPSTIGMSSLRPKF